MAQALPRDVRRDRRVALRPPREKVDGDDFADMVSTIHGVGIVMAKALDDPLCMPRQIMVLRSFVKLPFAPHTQPG